MIRPYGVFVNGLLMNQFNSRYGAQALVESFARQGIAAEIIVLNELAGVI